MNGNSNQNEDHSNLLALASTGNNTNYSSSSTSSYNTQNGNGNNISKEKSTTSSGSSVNYDNVRPGGMVRAGGLVGSALLNQPSPSSASTQSVTTTATAPNSNYQNQNQTQRMFSSAEDLTSNSAAAATLHLQFAQQQQALQSAHANSQSQLQNIPIMNPNSTSSSASSSSSLPNSSNNPSTSHLHHTLSAFNQILPEDMEDSCDDEPRMEKRAGRRKIKIEYIEDKSRRHITFSKRKAGIMKKAYELSTLTGTQVLLLVASETGHVYTFATPKLQPLITKHEGKNLIQACLNAPEPGMDLLSSGGYGGGGGGAVGGNDHSHLHGGHHGSHGHHNDYGVVSNNVAAMAAANHHQLQHDNLSAALKLSGAAVNPNNVSNNGSPYVGTVGSNGNGGSNGVGGGGGQYPTTSLPLNLLPNPAAHQYHQQYMAAAYPYWQKPTGDVGDYQDKE